MKRILSIVLVFVLLFSLTGCSKTDVDENTIIVEKKGQIVGAIVEKFDKDYYDKDELESYVKDAIDAYNDEAGNEQIELTTYKVEDDIAKLVITYNSMKDYAKFNDVLLYTGTIKEALIADYDFDSDFVTVEEGKLGKSVDLDTVKQDDDIKVLILNECTAVSVPGTICYVSSDNVTVTGEDTAKVQAADEKDITPDEKEVTPDESEIKNDTIEVVNNKLSKLAYIIYK